MLNPALDKQFAGSIPHLYQTHLVPVIFAPYAVDMAGCLQERKLERCWRSPRGLPPKSCGPVSAPDRWKARSRRRW